jgi:aldose sugar dehydrogenase
MLRKIILAVLPLPLAACNSTSVEAGATKDSETPFQITPVATFNEPWAMTFLPGGKQALITEKSGKLLLWEEGKPAQIVSGTPTVDYGGQGGLGDVILAPDFATSKTIYLSWVEAGEGGTRGAVVGKARLNLDGEKPSISTAEIIWKQVPKVEGRGHFGHRLAFGPDGYLYISSGERQKFDPAQDIRANLGKVLRITSGGAPATDNPYSEQALKLSSRTTEMEQIWSLGQRNPLGLAFDEAGRLWEVEMGPQGGDEVNLIKPGANYGYPKVSNGSHYGGADIPDHASGDGFEAPKVWWNPSISPGSLMIYTGDLFPKWKGDAFIGALGAKALIRVDLEGERASKADQWDMGARIREVEQGTDGSIWLLEDGPKGRLLKLTPKG